MALLGKKTPKFQEGNKVVTSFPHDDTAMAKGFADNRIEVRDVYEWTDSSYQPDWDLIKNRAKTKGISIEESKNKTLDYLKKRHPNQTFRWKGRKLQHPKDKSAGKAYVSSSEHWYTEGTDITPQGLDPDKKVSPDNDPRTRMGVDLNKSSQNARGGKLSRIGYKLNGGKLLLK